MVSPHITVSRQTGGGAEEEQQRTEICLQPQQSWRKHCYFPDNQGPLCTNVQLSPESGNSPCRGWGTTSTPGSGQKPAPAFPAWGTVWAGCERPPSPAQQQGPKEAQEVPWAGRAEACLLHLHTGSVFLWPCCWKLQLLAAAQVCLDKSPFSRRESLEEGPLSLWENILSSESGLYVLHVSTVLYIHRKQASSRTRCGDCSLGVWGGREGDLCRLCGLRKTLELIIAVLFTWLNKDLCSLPEQPRPYLSNWLNKSLMYNVSESQGFLSIYYYIRPLTFWVR